jgi:hypothetical protein
MLAPPVLLVTELFGLVSEATTIIHPSHHTIADQYNTSSVCGIFVSPVTQCTNVPSRLTSWVEAELRPQDRDHSRGSTTVARVSNESTKACYLTFHRSRGTAPAVGLRATSSVPGGAFAKSTKCSMWKSLSLPYCTYMNRDREKAPCNFKEIAAPSRRKRRPVGRPSTPG